jgi:hypothetical protein
MNDALTKSCALVGAGALILALSAVTVTDPDLWGHVRFGLDMLDTWRLPHVDPYSFTQDVPWINHEWLSELQMGAAYRTGGAPGLSLLKGLLVSTTLWLVWTSLQGVHLTVRTLIMGAVGIGLAPAAQTLRPQLWSMVAIAILCRFLARGASPRLVLLPLLFLMWANLHGGFLVGLGILAAWSAGAVLFDRREGWRWVAVAAVCGLATLGTPYGTALWRFLAETVRWSRPGIDEWRPLWSKPGLLAIWSVAVVATVWGVRGVRTRGASVALVAAMLAFASLRVARILPLYVEAIVMLIAPALAARWPAARPRLRPFDRAERIAAVVIFMAASAAAAMIGAVRLTCVVVPDDWQPPSIAARQLLASAPPGRLVSFFNWGEYAIWHLSPALRVSMDGRRETVYSQARLDEHAGILNGTTAGLRTLEAWAAEYVWLPATSVATRQWLGAHGYRLEWESAEAWVAVRADLPGLPVKNVTPLAGRRCFPQ